MQLQNKVAFITGTGSGIGKAAAVLFAKQGAKIALISDDEKEVNDTAREIGSSALPISCDVAQADQVESAVKKTIERFGKIDIVYANAGINGVWAPIEEISPREWDHTININLRGTYLTIHYTVPHLKKNGGGSILVTSSVNGTRTFSNTGATAYSATKAAQLAITQMLAVELAQFNIRINCICPGAIDTEISQNTQKRDLEKVKLEAKYERPIPLHNKPGLSQQVADLALFLASDASSHITGTPVWIDGAQSLIR